MFFCETESMALPNTSVPSLQHLLIASHILIMDMQCLCLCQFGSDSVPS